MEKISSRANQLVKAARALSMAKERKVTGLHFAESDKLIREILSSDVTVQRIFMVEGSPALPVSETTELISVTPEVMEYLCESKTPQKYCAVVETPDSTPPSYYPDGLIIILDCLQDSGNLGTILRTADAFGAAGILLGDGCADPYSPKSLRAAMGSTYHIPVWKGNLSVELPLLKAQGFTCICGHLHGSENLPSINSKTAIVIGNEGNGVSESVASECELYRLKMYGRAESLNAAIAAGILIYEVSGRMHE